MKREAAWRVFAGEYNDSTIEVKGDGEKTPSYIVTPLGAKVNRLFVIGVLTDVENISESGELLRAHISDPTGVYTLYSGNYQPEATEALSNIEVPAFVAVVGKSRTYTPEEGMMWVSIRPEKVVEVDSQVRDQWILETCESTRDRIEAVIEAQKMNPYSSYDMRKLGYSQDLSDGIGTALKKYENINIEKYVTLIQESLQYLRPGREKLPDLKKPKPADEQETMEEKKPVEEPEKKQRDAKKEKPEKKTEAEKEEKPDFKEIENNVLKIIKELEGEEGALWDEITKKCEKTGLDKDTVEEAITSLMDKGMIYEPILGTIKST